ncbi:MAG: hypothetical protein ACTSXQ_07255 [Alphaproteobacteria bacterium]
MAQDEFETWNILQNKHGSDIWGAAYEANIGWQKQEEMTVAKKLGQEFVEGSFKDQQGLR